MVNYWERDLTREIEQREDDKLTRARLEKQSPSAARVNFVDHLNAIASADAKRQAPGLDAIEDIRRRQRGVHSAPSGYNFSDRDPGQVAGSRFEQLSRMRRSSARAG